MFCKNQAKTVFKLIVSTVRHLMSKELAFSEFGNPVQVVKMRLKEVPILGAQDVLVRMLAAPVNPSDINTIQVSTVRYLMSKELVFSEFGNPVQVVKMRLKEVPRLGAQDVLVRMLAAPVNPSDINTIQGKYPLSLSLPHVPGNEGVGLVEQIGLYVKCIRPGNKVIVTTPGQGTWREFAVINEDALKVVPNYLQLVEAATLAINPCTAYRMLSDFKPVRQCNMSIIQNGANSAVGQCVIQLCKAWGIQNINILRCRPKVNVLKCHLKKLGGSFVITEDEVKTTAIFKDKLIHRPSLALNCVGGKSATQLLKQLNPNGCMVTYGGMSKKPVSIPTTAFIFKNLTFHGFWMTAWNTIASTYAKDEMLSELIALMVDRRIVAPEHKKVGFDDFQEALCNTLRGYQGCKYILDFRKK